jgi:hypothetical protein
MGGSMKSTTPLLIFLFLGSLALASKDPSKSNKAKLIYHSILKNGWLEEKKNLGYELGLLGEDAEPFVIKLYSEKSYWDRYAAISASTNYFSSSVNKSLVKIYLEDHMTEDESEKALQLHIDLYVPELIKVWDSPVNMESKKKVLKLLAISNLPQARELTKSEIENTKSKYRVFAFESLCSKNPISDGEYIRSKINDKELRFASLKYVLETGDQKDKQLMIDILNEPKISSFEFTYAIGGIKKWGTLAEQELEYSKALQNPKYDESLKIYSIYLFKEIRSEPIRSSLCELADNAKYQTARLTAAESILPYQNLQNRKCLQRISKEEYQPSSSSFGFIDVVAMFATLGLSNVIRGIQENRSMANFLGRQNEIKKHLQFLDQKAKEKE